MKLKMKQSHWLRLSSASLLIIILVNPVSTRVALASEVNQPVSAQTTVTASAVVVPAQVSQLGFLISALAREVPVKEGDPVKAGQTLMVLDTPDLEFAVTEAQAALHSAQAYADLQKYSRVKNRRNGKIFYDAVPVEFRQRADARVQQAQVAVELAQVNLVEGTLTAPFDGTVASMGVIPGEFVQSDQGVVTLATLNNLQLETTDLSEQDIARVKIGAPVSISAEALNQTFHGKVISISPVSNTVGGDVVFKVTIAFDKQPENLLWGMTAEVTIGE
jgi:RND family efflux transporter MFP subunit